jgi:hypothetical protein
MLDYRRVDDFARLNIANSDHVDQFLCEID